MKLWVGIVVGLAVVAGFILFGEFLGWPAFLKQSPLPMTPQLASESGEVLPGSIAVIETITLGGIEQAITIRGENVGNPVLLFLHGGPGVPSSPWATWNDYYSRLEENFILAHWDQRGAGKSYSRDLTAEDMALSAFVRDALELADYLRERFRQERIFLWGHSWGSGLGFEILRTDESRFYAFIASATRPAWNTSQSLGYEKVLELARAAEDASAVRVLEGLAPFDPTNPEHVAVRGEYLARFRVGDFRTRGLEDEWLGYVFRGDSPEYPSSLINQTVRGIEFTRNTIGRQVMLSEYDHAQDFPESTIPVYFLHGRYDFECPGELAYEYYETLQAPIKEFVWFENAAHDVNFDEPRRFADEMARIAAEVSSDPATVEEDGS